MLPFWKPDLRADIDAELQFHLETHVRDLIASGRSPAAAREEAERRFGEQRAVRDACIAIDTRRREREHRREVLGAMWQDLRFAFRTLRKNSGFTLIAVLCVGLGVGVTGTILSAVHAILLRPLPYQRSDELVAVYSRLTRANERIGGINISYPDYLSWRDQNRSFAELGMWTWSALAFSGEREAERVEAATVTANLFPLLGVTPVLGRGFLPEEEHSGRQRVVLLGYGLWQRRFGGDRSIVGRSVTLDGFPYLVIGVMPSGFAFPDRGQAWIPFVAEEGGQEGRGNRGYAGALGRLKPGVTVAQAQRDLDLISARLQREFGRDEFGWDAEAIPLREDLVGDWRRPLLVFLGAVALVLLIVCANVANLMLTRGTARRKEIAVRTAIGAGRRRLLRQLMTESLLLAAAGGAVGVLLASFGVRFFALAMPSGVPWYIALRVDGTTLLLTGLVSALTGVLCGLLPAFRSTNLNLSGALRDGAGAGDGRQRTLLRSALVVTEVAVSLLLMIGATLLLKSYRNLLSTELGFEPRGVLTFRVSLLEANYGDPARRRAFFTELFDRLRALPGVQTVGSANGIPFSGWNVQAEMNVEGHPEHPVGQELIVHHQSITPGYFESLGIPILRGRGLTSLDRDTANRVGVINESLARKEFAAENPIGRRIKIGLLADPEPWVTIVGVVRDFRHYRLPQPMGPAIYYSFDQNPWYTRTVTIRAAGDPLALLPAVRASLKQIDPDVPLYQPQSMEQALDRSLWRQRLQGQVIGLFAALALVLAAVGMYGVISYAVAQRSREMGVRMALGASGGQVVGLVVRQGLLLALLGTGLGLAGALALTRVLAKLLYEVRVTDLATFISVPLLLGGVAVLASWLPARRAARVDPLVAMRAE